MKTLAEFMETADDHRLDESAWAKAMLTAGALTAAAAGAMHGIGDGHVHIGHNGQVMSTERGPGHAGEKSTYGMYGQNYSEHGGEGMKRYREMTARHEAEQRAARK